MNDLITYGVAVFPLDPGLMLHTQIRTILGEMPELIDPVFARNELRYKMNQVDHPAQIAIGGFGATGCPSLIHHPEIRIIRRKIYDAMRPEFARAFRGRRLEVLFNRFNIRRWGTEVPKETWHRDVGPKKLGDTIYGGWINLDPPGSPPQHFSCIPGDVLPAGVDAMGFAKFDKGKGDALEAAFKASAGAIPVPPGHLLVFDQTIAHKISGGKSTFTSFRLSAAWRITDYTEPISDPEKPFYDKDAIIDNQSMCQLPSGQDAPMYAALQLVNWKPRLRAFSDTFKPEFRDMAAFKSNGTPNPLQGIVYRQCPSLVSTGHAFPPYSPGDRAMFFPVLL